jgi:protein-disulfide isomerase
MPSSLTRLLALATVVAACSRADAAPRVASTSTAATVPTNTLPAAAAHDSISDRADRGRILGDSGASLWVIVASDFQCPYCKEWHDSDFKKIVDKYVKTGRVRLAFINMPLSMHQHAVEAAEAAMCASVQNKFWPMHEALFSAQQRWEVLPDPGPTFASLASGVGVNMTAWQQCVKQHLTLPLIQADRDRVVAAHVNSTPTFFVGGQVLPGADAKLSEAIDAALAKTPRVKSPAG